MSVTETVPARTLPYRGCLAAPFQNVSVTVLGYSWGFLIKYRGLPDDLVRCGAVTEELLAPRRHGQRGRGTGLAPRRDRDGDHVSVLRPKRSNRIHVHRYRTSWGPWDESLPGFEPWMVEAAREAEAQARNVKTAPPSPAAPAQGRPLFRLVVDNTRAKPVVDHDATAPRLRAFVASMQPSVAEGDLYENYTDGRDLIEQLAVSATGTEPPTLRLSGRQVADVLYYLACSQPKEPVGWWKDPKQAASHVAGFTMLLNALEESLRKG
jgi:hypothetical protein